MCSSSLSFRFSSWLKLFINNTLNENHKSLLNIIIFLGRSFQKIVILGLSIPLPFLLRNFLRFLKINLIPNQNTLHFFLSMLFHLCWPGIKIFISFSPCYIINHHNTTGLIIKFLANRIVFFLACSIPKFHINRFSINFNNFRKKVSSNGRNSFFSKLIVYESVY